MALSLEKWHAAFRATFGGRRRRPDAETRASDAEWPTHQDNSQVATDRASDICGNVRLQYTGGRRAQEPLGNLKSIVQAAVASKRRGSASSASGHTPEQLPAVRSRQHATPEHVRMLLEDPHHFFNQVAVARSFRCWQTRTSAIKYDSCSTTSGLAHCCKASRSFASGERDAYRWRDHTPCSEHPQHWSSIFHSRRDEQLARGVCAAVVVSEMVFPL